MNSRTLVLGTSPMQPGTPHPSAPPGPGPGPSKAMRGAPAPDGRPILPPPGPNPQGPKPTPKTPRWAMACLLAAFVLFAAGLGWWDVFVVPLAVAAVVGAR